MIGSGGTPGGIGKFWIGFVLMALGVYFFFDSVRVTTGQFGWISRQTSGWFGGHTGSMGIVFLPFIIGVISLFYDSKQTWAWVLMYAGLAVIAVEILSRVHFLMNVKTTHLLMMFVLFAGGVGLMLHSYRDSSKKKVDE